LSFNRTRTEVLTVFYIPVLWSQARLERRGWIEALEAEDRRPYHITGAGESVLREQLKTLHRMVSVGQQRLSPT